MRALRKSSARRTSRPAESRAVIQAGLSSSTTVGRGSQVTEGAQRGPCYRLAPALLDEVAGFWDDQRFRTPPDLAAQRVHRCHVRIFFSDSHEV